MRYEKERGRALIAFLSYSGNTEEIAEIIESTLQDCNFDVTMYDIAGFQTLPDPRDYDLVILGSFTWDRGTTPDEMKDFVQDIGYKPDNVFVFGSGDTQFGGDETFCGAATKLAKFYNSTKEPLKVEQSPRGTQVSNVVKWASEVAQFNLQGV